MKFLVALPILLACFAVQAAPIAIIDLPSETSGGFAHNLFHDSSNQLGQTGATKAWFNLGTGGSYDPVTGAFNLNINLFSDSGLTLGIGTADAVGVLPAANFTGLNSLALIGTIEWTFDGTAQANGLPASSLMEFVDRNYAVSDAGYIPNTLQDAAGIPDNTSFVSMTLWGSDCGLELVDPANAGNCANFVPGAVNGLGVDFVATFVPVPAAVWLFGSGLLALVGISRRRARAD